MEPVQVRMKGHWSHPSQRRQVYRMKSYGVEPFNQCRKATCQAPRNIRTVARESKIIGKNWNALKALAPDALEDRRY